MLLFFDTSVQQDVFPQLGIQTKLDGRLSLVVTDVDLLFSPAFLSKLNGFGKTLRIHLLE